MNSSLLWVGVGVLLLMAGVSAHSAYDNCTAPYDCPGSTTCRCNGPDGYQCRCADGYTIDEDRGGHECVKAVRVLEPCDSVNNKCVPHTTFCNVDAGRCECLPGYRVSENNNTCVQEGQRTIRESCNTDAECELLQSCNSTEKVCECLQAFRLKTQQEYDALPDDPLHCVLESFNLNSPQHCPETTTAYVPTTTTQSTTTTTQSVPTTSAQSITASTQSTTTIAQSTTVNTRPTPISEQSTTVNTRPTPISEQSTTPTTTATPSSSATITTTSKPLIETQLFERCTNTSECQGNAVCGALRCGESVCHCKEGYAASPDKTTCLKKSLIGQSCSTTSECLPFLSYCTNNVCKCSWFMRETKGYRPLCTYSRYLLGEYVPPGATCQDSNAAPSRDRTCQCKTGFRPKTDTEFWADPRDIVECVSDSTETCLPTGSDTTTLSTTSAPPITVPPRNRLIMDACTNDGECPLNSICQQRSCGNVCVCNERFVASSDRSYCIPGKLIGEVCSESSECFPTLSFCDGTCRCQGYALKTKSHSCIRRTNFFKKTLGGVCTSPFNCLWTGSACVGGQCACGPGYREKTPAELWGNATDDRECVPLDYVLGCPAK